MTNQGPDDSAPITAQDVISHIVSSSGRITPDPLEKMQARWKMPPKGPNSNQLGDQEIDERLEEIGNYIKAYLLMHGNSESFSDSAKRHQYESLMEKFSYLQGRLADAVQELLRGKHGT